MNTQVSLWAFLVFAEQQLSFSLPMFGEDILFSLLAMTAAVLTTAIASGVLAHGRFDKAYFAVLRVHSITIFLAAILLAAAMTIGTYSLWVLLPVSIFFGFGLVFFR